MAEQDHSTDVDVKRSFQFTESEPKKLSENPSNTFFENREYKSITSEKCRSHQTLSFKRNLLDLEFNAAHGDSGTKKCTEDLIDLFERKSNATNALQVPNEPVESPRKKEIVVPEQEAVNKKKSRLAIILAETDEDLSASVDSGAEDFEKEDVLSFDYESTEEIIEKAEPSLEIEDKLSANESFQSEFVDFDKRESISDKLEESQALLVDNISTDGEEIPQQKQHVEESATNDEDENNFMNRIKCLKQSMDEINSMIAIEKDFLRQEKLELENSFTIVPYENVNNIVSYRMDSQDPRKVLEAMRQKERKLKLTFQMKQLEEAQRRCSSEMQLISNTADEVDQLNQDMAVYSLEELSYTTVKDNDYSLSKRTARTPNLSPNSSPRFSIGSERTTHGRARSSCVSEVNIKTFDRSLMSPIEFTMGDTRLQMQAADHFKLKISQLEAQLNSDTLQPPPHLFTARRSGRISPLTSFNDELMIDLH